nr:Pycsar system effector family protein [Novosphingobium flavum]
MVRTALQANLTLSQMADQKASILMGATFVVFTLAVGQSSRGHVSLPLLVLGVSAFFSAAFTIAALMPAVAQPHGAVSERDNILFFGIYAKLSEEEFAARVMPLLGDDEAIYRAMLRDMHQNGLVLARKKYRLLGYAYRVFLVGLALTMACFAAEYAGVLG